MPHRRFDLLVCDLDDTLYDWVGFFVPAFYAMVDAAVGVLDCDRETLLDDLRTVHRRHHDSEHPFALLEAATVRGALPGLTVAERKARLDPAFHAYNRTRKESLALHDGVEDTLASLRAAGVRLVAHTESKTLGAVDRLTRLEIDRYFSRLYCREKAAGEHPDGPQAATPARFRAFDGRLVELACHQRKPSPDVLREICADEDIPPHRTAYVGDSIARDMAMAKEAGVFAIWAAYGARHDPEDYAKLVRISHWTREDVARETRLKAAAADVRPDAVCEAGFAEVLPLLLDPPRAVAVG